MGGNSNDERCLIKSNREAQTSSIWISSDILIDKTNDGPPYCRKMSEKKQLTVTDCKVKWKASQTTEMSSE